MKTKSFFNAAILSAFSIFLISCSPQSTRIPISTNTPTILPASLPSVTTAQFPTFTPSASPTSQLKPTPSTSPSTLEFVRKISGGPNSFSMPDNLAFDTKGDLYVLDAGNDRVQVFDPSGKFITTWGNKGSGIGQFDLVVHEDTTYTIGGIALDKNNNVYVADGLNQRVQEFNSRGKFLMKWGSYGLNDGEFLRLLDLAIDIQGNLYVVDDYRDVIQKFDPHGKFILKFGEEGKGDGELNNTGGITIGPDGNLYIADYGNNRVEVFSPDGTYLRQWSTPVKGVVDIAIDSKGNIFTTHEIGDIVEYDPNGNAISIMGNLGLNSPIGIVINSDGLIYVADNNGIEVFREK